MNNISKLAVVMPVYNEAAVIESVLRKWSGELQRLGIDFKIHVYNDGSKDGTSKVLVNYAQADKHIVVHEKANSGHGPTILLGYSDNVDSEWIFQVDSDDELLPEDFSKLWNIRDQYDFVVGSRSQRAQPLSRFIITRISRLVVWGLFGRVIGDVNSPYRLMRAAAFKELYSLIPKDTFAPNLLVTGLAASRHLRTAEIPVRYKLRETGEVSIKKWKLLRSALKSLRQVCAFRFRRR